jgi:hypothetical protein
MNNPWFKRFGWFYRPNSWQGAAILILAVIFCVQVFVAIDRHSHSVSDTLYGVFPYFACCFLLLNWVAANASDLKSEPADHEQKRSGSTEA